MHKKKVAVLAKVYNANIEKIIELAKEKGIKMKYFCDQFGKQRSFMTDIKNGKNFLEEEQLQFIATELNTTIEYLTDQTEQKEKPTVLTDDELDPEIEELLDLLEQMHPDDVRQIIDFAKWLIAKNKTEGV